jgi:hypothetical protein
MSKDTMYTIIIIKSYKKHKKSRKNKHINYQMIVCYMFNIIKHYQFLSKHHYIFFLDKYYAVSERIILLYFKKLWFYNTILKKIKIGNNRTLANYMYCYTCLNTIELAFNSCMFFLYNTFILSNLNIYFYLDVLLRNIYF